MRRSELNQYVYVLQLSDRALSLVAALCLIFLLIWGSAGEVIASTDRGLGDRGRSLPVSVAVHARSPEGGGSNTTNTIIYGINSANRVRVQADYGRFDQKSSLNTGDDAIESSQSEDGHSGSGQAITYSSPMTAAFEPVGMPREADYVAVPADKAAGSIDGAIAALVPGFFLHGTGHLVAGEKETALRLALGQAVSMGIAGLGWGATQLAGDSPVGGYLAETLLFAGLAGFAGGYALDLIGTMAGPGGVPSLPVQEHVLDASIDYLLMTSGDWNENRHFTRVGMEWDRYRLTAYGAVFSDLGFTLFEDYPTRSGFQLGSHFVVWRRAKGLENFRISSLGALEGWGVREDTLLDVQLTGDINLNMGRLISAFQNINLEASAGVLGEWSDIPDLADMIGDNQVRYFPVMEAGMVVGLSDALGLSLKLRNYDEHIRCLFSPMRAPVGVGLRVWSESNLLFHVNFDFGNGDLQATARIRYGLIK